MYISANHKNGKPIHMNDNYKRQLAKWLIDQKELLE